MQLSVSPADNNNRHKLAGTDKQEFARDSMAGLASGRQKSLPAKYLYDDLGSCLFEAITLLPEYGVTRAEIGLLERHAHEMVAAAGGSPLSVIELGAGSGRKAGYLLHAIRERQGTAVYYPIDVSELALSRCRRELGGSVSVIPVCATYLDGFRAVTAKRQLSQRLLVLFLGSNIGNMDRREAGVFLSELRTSMMPGDRMLLGFDLIKPIEKLMLAYDDPSGVTAAFNKNLLNRINREFDGDFDVSQFNHVVRWDASLKRIEMHLESRKEQTIHLAALEQPVHFKKHETIWTESSYKFTETIIRALAEDAGFRQEWCWQDDRWMFSNCLWTAA
ncbi:MAG TPA: L-histidine N(alpha)-methyltransferase [Bryobacteraceae bacterium]|nr:L-histidine N(alpha)-methyltransferase [Bryobacteraceae bacterium]